MRRTQNQHLIVRMDEISTAQFSMGTPARTLRKDAAWLFRAMWKFLIRWGATDIFYEERMRVARVPLNGEKVAALILNAFEGCFPHSKPERIYIGPGEFDELIGEPNIQQYLTRKSTILGGLNYGDENGVAFHEVPITIIPHMRGVLVL